MKEPFQFIYNEKQEKALEYLGRDSEVNWVLYGGAAGGGKSYLGCAWQIQRRMKYPKTVGLIGRAELKKLRLSTMVTFHKLLAAMNLRSGSDFHYNGQDHVFTFKNGSAIMLMDLADLPSDPEFQRFGSIELTDYFVDEVGEVSSRCISILNSRVRFNLINGKPKGMMSCNPAKGWLYNDFYKPSVDNELRSDRAFVAALPSDNPHLPESYLRSLELLPEADRKRLLHGDWDFDTSEDRIFNIDDLLRCFRNELIPGQKYLTADIARLGKDRTVIAYWEGMTLVEFFIYRQKRTDEVVQIMRDLIKEKGVNLRNVIADEDGIGGGTVDHLKCRGFMNGSKATQPDKYVNLKAECYFKLGSLVESNSITFTCGHRDELVRELDLIRRKNVLKDGKLAVTGKEEIQRAHGFSPDLADAVMMRMFFELKPNYGVYAIK